MNSIESKRNPDIMKLATWNVNSLNVRLPHVLQWLETNPVDALCLQELKQPDEKFPIDAFRSMGYQAHWAGQKTYNGVAIVSREAGRDPQRNIPGFDDPHQRVVAATYPSSVGDIRVINAYCPNGQAVGSEKYEYKLRWFKALTVWLREELERYPRLALLGDYNIAPQDADVYDPAKWVGEILVSEPERAAFEQLLSLGLVDSFRKFPQEPEQFSWWDYRRFSFRRNAGMRIDHILLSGALNDYCVGCNIDKIPRGWEKPSDHTPVLTTLDFTSGQ